MSNDFLNKLNKAQKEAVMHRDGPVMIVAGAGTGKTTVITSRIFYLIEQGLAKPEEILALTFTEKASQEMEERVDQLLPFGYFDLWISTFHSFGEKILRENGLEIGLPSDFKLINTFEQWILLRKNLDKFQLDYYRPLGNPSKFINALLSHFSRAKDEDISCLEYLDYVENVKQNKDAMLSGVHNMDLEIKKLEEVANAYHLYNQLLLDNNSLDFADLINYSLKLFRTRPEILEKYRKQFKYILLDEFQDTNLAQYELIKLLASPKNNLMVVGDDDQAIYKFRGASISNILQFRLDYPDFKKIVLNDNYRNQQNILDLSYDFIQHNNPNRLEYQFNQDNSEKLDKRLVSHTGKSGVIELISENSLDDEVGAVIGKIIELKKEETTWNDFAILVRSNNSAKDFCNNLEKLDIPYVFLSSSGLYNKSLIMDVIAYFKLLDNYHESSAVYRILSCPIFAFSYQQIIDLTYLARKKAWSLFRVLDNARVLNLDLELVNKIDFLLSLIKKHSLLVIDNKKITEIFLAFMNDSNYLAYLKAKEEKIAREEFSYLNQFLKRIQKFETNTQDSSLKMFLEELAMEMEAGNTGQIAPDLEAGPEAVKIMTCHSAKGLEFKYVFVTNLVDKRFPSISREDAISLPKALLKEKIINDTEDNTEEERRLFYVAVTRARDHLYFSWAQDYGGVRAKKPSRFLFETKLLNEDDFSKKKPKEKINKALDLENSFVGENKEKENIKNEKKFQGAVVDLANYRLPKNFSFTKLIAFKNCPYQYYFSHVLQIPSMGKCQFSFGKTMHLALQKIFKLVLERKSSKQANLFSEEIKDNQELVAWAEVKKIYEEVWIDEWYKNEDEKQEYRKKGLKILQDFWQKYKKNWPNVAYIEKGFNLKVRSGDNNYLIKGSIDRIDEVDGELKIIDYKTGSAKEKIDADNKKQLFIYHLATETLFNQKIKSLSFYYLENNTELEFVASEKELEKTKLEIAELISEIAKGKFLAKPNLLCKYCDFFNICEYKQM